MMVLVDSLAELAEVAALAHVAAMLIHKYNTEAGGIGKRVLDLLQKFGGDDISQRIFHGNRLGVSHGSDGFGLG